MSHRRTTFMRVVKAGVQNFIRNATLAVAAIAVMVITLSIILFSIIANATFNNTIQQINDKIDISVYLNDNVSDEERDMLIRDLEAMDNVRQVTYLSKEQALEAYKEQNKDNLDLLLAISQADNPLPATIQIKPRDPNKISDIQAHLDKPEVKALQSDETSYSGDRRIALDNITSATRFMRQAGLVGVMVFAAVSMLIIFNTIRMAIFNRRDELQIMRLLGASTGFIRGPFIVETVLYGVVSAIISIVLCNVIFSVANSAFQATNFGLLDITFASNYFGQKFGWILLGQLTAGILIGAVSSIIATRRYLKFKSPK